MSENFPRGGSTSWKKVTLPTTNSSSDSSILLNKSTVYIYASKVQLISSREYVKKRIANSKQKDRKIHQVVLPPNKPEIIRRVLEFTFSGGKMLSEVENVQQCVGLNMSPPRNLSSKNSANTANKFCSRNSSPLTPSGPFSTHSKTVTISFTKPLKSFWRRTARWC
ncbi:Hypothetical predicted protein [Cloeon dipterum]|uniref:BTB domain-containing protein n=1 Tax=Cloeon dipterum TaxID=197152 RepID=A0A8S1DGI9_9INSE|nr:Hypothetical predicted protein [Cloeon dipterum]